MVSRRPHILKLKQISGGSDDYQGSDGNWVVPDSGSSTVKSFECRAEPNGSGKVIPGEDGKTIAYSWTVYVDKTVPKLLYGHCVEVFNKDNEKIAQGTVLMHSVGQMNARIWI